MLRILGLDYLCRLWRLGGRIQWSLLRCNLREFDHGKRCEGGNEKLGMVRKRLSLGY